jgi:hypothetical protein
MRSRYCQLDSFRNITIWVFRETPLLRREQWIRMRTWRKYRIAYTLFMKIRITIRRVHTVVYASVAAQIDPFFIRCSDNGYINRPPHNYVPKNRILAVELFKNSTRKHRFRISINCTFTSYDCSAISTQQIIVFIFHLHRVSWVKVLVGWWRHRSIPLSGFRRSSQQSGPRTTRSEQWRFFSSKTIISTIRATTTGSVYFCQ